MEIEEEQMFKNVKDKVLVRLEESIKRTEDYKKWVKSVYLIATRDLRISGCNFFYLKIKGLCDFLRKRF